jgi:hypothetical protein
MPRHLISDAHDWIIDIQASGLIIKTGLSPGQPVSFSFLSFLFLFLFLFSLTECDYRALPCEHEDERRDELREDASEAVEQLDAGAPHRFFCRETRSGWGRREELGFLPGRDYKGPTEFLRFKKHEAEEEDDDDDDDGDDDGDDDDYDDDDDDDYDDYVGSCQIVLHDVPSHDRASVLFYPYFLICAMISI